MFVSDRLLLTLDCIWLWNCTFNVHQIILVSIGCQVLRKTPCPVLMVFLCRGQMKYHTLLHKHTLRVSTVTT